MNFNIQTSINDYKTEIEQSSEIVALYFYSEECISCTSFDPIFENLADKYSDKFKFIKLLRQTNRQLAESMNITISPTVVFLRNGKETCSRLSGYIEGSEFKTLLEKIYEGNCEKVVRKKVICDVLIIGGGPAGLSAAIYAARAKLLTIILDKSMAGGQVATTYHVANYPGTNGVVRGIDLADNMKKQALSFGAELDELKEILEIKLEEKYVKSEDTEYCSKVIVIATGAQPRRLPAEGESEYRGRGVHYCATCDGALYQDTYVLVVGGGNSALDEAVFLTNYAKHVTIIHYGDSFSAAKAIQDKVKGNSNIDVMFNSRIIRVYGEHFLTGVTLEDIKTHEIKELKTDGVFVYIGMVPETQLFKGALNIDGSGYIITDEDMNTNISGVFAVGDVRQKKIRQIATATCDGVIAGIMGERYINEE